MLSIDYSVNVTFTCLGKPICAIRFTVIFEVFALLRGCRTTHAIWRRCGLTHAHTHTYVCTVCTQLS